MKNGQQHVSILRYLYNKCRRLTPLRGSQQRVWSGGADVDASQWEIFNFFITSFKSLFHFASYRIFVNE
jgi:hypothetical protein